MADPGLTSEQAARRLAESGLNRLPVQRATPWWHRLAAEMVHFFALLFWAAGGLAFIAGLPQLGIAIFVVVMLNAVFAFAQEERTQHAAEGLRQMLPRRATVLSAARQMSPAQFSGFSRGRSKLRIELLGSFAEPTLLAKVSPEPSSLSFASICDVAMPSAMQWWIFISSAHRLSVSPSMIQHCHGGGRSPAVAPCCCEHPE